MNGLKKVYVAIALIGAIASQSLYAQDKQSKVDSLLFASIEMYHSGDIFSESYWDKGIPSRSNIGYSIKLGYDFTPKLKTYINAKMEYDHYNRLTTQNFYTQVELGVGAAYTFISKDGHLYYEPDFSISSDVSSKSPMGLNTKLACKAGVNTNRYKPFISLFFEFMSPYEKTLKPCAYMGLSIGIDLL